MSRSVRQDYPPKGATMPRYTQALNDILENVSAPLPRVTEEESIRRINTARGGSLTYAPLPAADEPEPAVPDTVDVEVIIHSAGVALPVVRYVGLELSTVLEATGHLNDNAGRVEA